MRIDHISIERSTVSPTDYILRIESGGYTFIGYFDHLLTFMHAVGDAIKYFGQAHGLLERKADGQFESKVKK